jgi:hypothetical protein
MYNTFKWRWRKRFRGWDFESFDFQVLDSALRA